jgi:hypothetical protein
VDNTNNSFTFGELEGPLAFGLLDFKLNASRMEIFLRIVDQTLIEAILHRLQNEDPEAFTYGNKAQMDLSLDKIYKALAAKIRVQGLRGVPQRSRENKNPQRDAFGAALAYFKDTFPDDYCPGVDFVMRIHSTLLISTKEEIQLTRNLVNTVTNIGQWAAGDEKLFKFTGRSPWVRKVPNKPAKIGTWSYELTIKVNIGAIYSNTNLVVWIGS